ncbi:DNA polymerase-3 subunit gamma/tau [Lewinella marina]|uniref:DNA polymerase III subunit gamma/tau n=1 Tax=Neolewinella marina TaxID=438751 RepID=A0A2G0CKC1_9BACT|nr:DNA polymerase III subunit gamma/tau [Neolewinella marina]NJB84385.1 DNA polymerase-3 subunit gamma/tau [Neolewinella marina]PHL00419.1 DNA polymerase III subunit gamma/tau [Neolewinella marina]
MSNFVVSARKYRPVRFDEVVGQRHVSQTLKNALQTDHLAHAFLFCGPRGVGKTTSARILAKVLNCENRTADYEPCNSCPSCVSFNNNASLNITELDAASNNSVDHIRALTEQVRFQPQQGAYKVFIIDEVHMLSQQAFNAFLKTLEEPPPYAIFILATTEKHKIIPTILSRCQIFDFKRIQPNDIIEHLRGICEQEGITADEEALHIIAQKADGALRDALSIFDRIVSFSGDAIRYEAVIENLNVLDYDYFFRAVDCLLTEDRAGMLLLFDEVLRRGFDEDLFLNGLAAHLRDLLVCKDAATLQLLEVGDRLRERYHQQAAIAPADLLLTALDIANECDLGFRLARNKRLHVEMSLLRMVTIRRAFRNDPVSLAPAVGTPAPAAAPTAEVPPAPVAEKKSPDPDPAPEEIGEQPPISPMAPPPSAPGPAAFASINLDSLIAEAEEETAHEVPADELPELDDEHLRGAWDAFLAEQQGTTLAVFLKQALPLVRGEEEIVVKVGSARAIASLRDDDSLIAHLRKTFQRPNLVMILEQDDSLKPVQTKAKKRLTAKDKYLKMREKNPALDELRRRFDLRPEE